MQPSERRKDLYKVHPPKRKSQVAVRESHDIAKGLPKGQVHSLIDQLKRASESTPLNLAEGSARFSKADKCNFFRIARGSAFQCVAVLDVLQELGLLATDVHVALNTRLANLGRMLSGLIRYIEQNGAKTNS